ncbi:TetR/AcrR family transcriptional regulator [Mycobacterium sp. MYCO198283]|uniref:TetR/AcrR family transcriptional regulator n=1 Tax=Mycobacterium sp. MYCO198283 TaxID=2883505 RepID=UPI001E3DAC26|nr:TetR/AcrR family transcriptional regulator [Mycobacterium sp. MYCO198283]MCG5434401.1 TetR/AcrR family transcriptional regulator [Mycobacterium sp. MYCO198283]
MTHPLGRPRDPQRHRAVLEATRDLLVLDGYEHLTLAHVARRARVSRPYVYQRWGSKFALVEEAIFAVYDRHPPVDPGRPFAQTFVELIATMVRIQSDPAFLAGLPGLVAEMVHRPDLVRRVEDRYVADVRALYVEAVAGGVAQGVVRPGVDGSALVDTVRGAVMMHTLANPTLTGDALVDHLAGTLLGGLLLPSPDHQPAAHTEGRT